MRRAEKINYLRRVKRFDSRIDRGINIGIDFNLKLNSLLIFKFEVENIDGFFPNKCASNEDGSKTEYFQEDEERHSPKNCIIQTASVFKSIKFDNKEPYLFEEEDKILKENPITITEKKFELVYIMDEDVESTLWMEFNPNAFKFPNDAAYLKLVSIENEVPVTGKFMDDIYFDFPPKTFLN